MKRTFDILISLTGLLVLLPVFFFLVVIIFTKLGKPIFFIQLRPGLHSKPFRMIKFRTMLDVIDKNGNPLPDEKRMTRLGTFLRSTSLDELPELWNVLKGDMSLCGPRPLLMEYLPLYSGKQMRRHEVRPGITGWAQINGRNAISWEKKFELDVWYVDHRSFWLDVKILWRTVYKVFFREGVSQQGQVTAEKFQGTSE